MPNDKPKKSRYTLKQRQDARLKAARKKRAAYLGSEGPKRSVPSGRRTAAQRRAADQRMDAKGRKTTRMFRRSVGR